MVPAALGARPIPWRNWSGSQVCYPAQRVAPASVEELREVISGTAGTVRPVGSGHSFTPLVPTDDTIISLSRLSGIVDVDPESLQATLLAGTQLGDLGQPLETAGQALINMPDIDEQILAGCLATATHGTGAGIGCMSDYIQALQLVDGRGDLVDCSRDQNPDIFRAAQVSLGAMGVITQVRLQNMAPYR
ncbi:MAG: FAD-binding protein, partial [Halieaceae bacterium]|nr:FAD-binding protein [Halieaceae bacterium]